MKGGIFFGAVMTLLLTASCSQPKIAYIDIEVLMQEYAATKELEQSLAEKQAAYTRELDSLQKPFQEKLQDYYRNESSMSALTKARIEQELQTEQQRFQERQQQVTFLLQEENQRESELLTKRVDSIVEQYAKANDLEIILGTTGKGTVIFARDQYDITDAILTRLNADYTK